MKNNKIACRTRYFLFSLITLFCVAPQAGYTATAKSESAMAGELWRTRIGLTTYRSTIHVHDGKVIVNSNGNSFGEEKDALDGVYVLDASTGTLLEVLLPVGEGERDANGVAITKNRYIFGTDQEVLYSFDFTGRLIWLHKFSGDIEAAPALADFNRDGIDDIAVGIENHDFYVLSGKNGEIIHHIRTLIGDYDQTGYNATVALSDVTGDGIPEIFLPGRDNTMRTFDGESGEELWRDTRFSGMHSPPILVDVDGDGRLEIIYAESYSNVVVADAATGEPVWVVELEHPGRGIEGLFGPLTWLPERQCVLVGTAWWGTEEGLYCVGEDGPLWRFTVAKKNITSGAVIGDIDGKPGPEIVFGTEAGELVGLDLDGNKVWSFITGGPIEATPTLADLDGDGKTEILVASNDGLLTAVKTNGIEKPVLPYYRGGSKNTGVLFWHDDSRTQASESASVKR